MKPTKLSKAETKRRLILRFMQQENLDVVAAAQKADQVMAQIAASGNN